MSNRNRGDISFEANGKTWTMKIGTQAMCEIEGVTSKTIAEVGRLLGDENTASISLMRAVFWGALQAHHEGVTLKQAAEVIDGVGMAEAGRLIGEAFQAAMPQKKGGDARPPAATTS